MENLISTEQYLLKQAEAELGGFRKVLTYLWDDNQEAFNALYFIKTNYVEWPIIFKYLKDNKLTGQKLADLFKNESPDGGGYHMGVTYILSRIKGHKFSTSGIKMDQLK